MNSDKKPPESSQKPKKRGPKPEVLKLDVDPEEGLERLLRKEPAQDDDEEAEDRDRETPA